MAVISIVCYFLIVRSLLLLVRNGNELVDYFLVNLNTFVLSNLKLLIMLMKNYLKLFLIIGVFSLLTYLSSLKTDCQVNVLMLQNVDALAMGEGGMGISCVGYGSLDCPLSLNKVLYVSQ